MFTDGGKLRFWARKDASHGKNIPLGMEKHFPREGRIFSSGGKNPRLARSLTFSCGREEEDR